jgi:acid phosphatase family membrane protein YuiD
MLYRGTIIPSVRRLFRRSETDEEANDTEYAFVKSKSLISRILEPVGGKTGLFSIAFFVFAVLYVFQNEISLRVARTMAKRLKRLSARVERGEEGLDESDLKVFNGWRWRVLMW